MQPQVDHTRNYGRNCQPVTPPLATDDELLAQRRAILAEQQQVQARCQRELNRLRADFIVVMRELHWPLGCVTRPQRAA